MNLSTPMQQSEIDEGLAREPLRLRCPQCGSDYRAATCCAACGFEMKEDRGVFMALAPDRLLHYARFAADYQSIRNAEGRGSSSADYYLGLPHVDTTGRNSQQWEIRAKSYEYLIRHILPQRGEGRAVLDLGAGNCWLSYRLAKRGYQPVAVDLLSNAQDGLGAGIHYEQALGMAIPRFQAELGNLPFRDSQFHVAIFNASFHYAEDYKSILREVLRCLKPGGEIVVCDTPWYAEESQGDQMVAERRAAFHERFKTASDALQSMEYLTDERLEALASTLSIHWAVSKPWYGWRWSMRPWIAKIRGRREPSQFRIYVAKRNED